MESSITKPQSFDDLPLAEPHFDDEVTLLSARPVVPLNEVSAGPRFSRGLGFALALIAALLVGALSATLVYKLRDGDGQLAVTGEEGQAQQEPETQLKDAYGGITSSTAANAPETATSTPEQESADLDTDSGLQKEPEQKEPEQKELDKRASTKPAGSESTRRDRDRAAELPADSEESFDPREIEKEPAEYDREIRRQSRREAHRLKHGKRGRADDAARIREIFEGSPRP